MSFKKIYSVLDEHSSKLDEHFSKLKEHDHRFDRIDVELSGLKQDVGGLKQQVVNIDNRLGTVEERQLRDGILAEDTNRTVKLILEVVNHVQTQKVDRSEFSEAVDKHDIRIGAVENALRNRLKT